MTEMKNDISREELIKKSVFQFKDSEIYDQYLIPGEWGISSEENIFGYWLLVFKSTDLLITWKSIYEIFRRFVNSNHQLAKLIELEKTVKLDENSIWLNRGFNEAYTTESYAEFLEYGDCQPNEWIIRDLDKLKKALEQPFDFKFKSESKKRIIEGLIQKSFVNPSFEFKWTDEPFSWTLYIPPIDLEDVNNWNL